MGQENVLRQSNLVPTALSKFHSIALQSEFINDTKVLRRITKKNNKILCAQLLKFESINLYCHWNFHIIKKMDIYHMETKIGELISRL